MTASVRSSFTGTLHASLLVGVEFGTNQSWLCSLSFGRLNFANVACGSMDTWQVPHCCLPPQPLLIGIPYSYNLFTSAPPGFSIMFLVTFLYLTVTGIIFLFRSETYVFIQLTSQYNIYIFFAPIFIRMDFSLFMLEKSYQEGDITTKQLIQLITYIRTPNTSNKVIPERPYNEFCSTVIEQQTQFNAGQSIFQFFKKKQPKIVHSIASSPNKLTYAIRLINNVFLIFNSFNEKITAFMPPPSTTTYYEFPQQKQIKLWTNQQKHVETDIIPCETIHYFCISDFGDLCLIFETSCIYFNYQTYTSHKLPIFGQDSSQVDIMQIARSTKVEKSQINNKQRHVCYSATFQPKEPNLLQSDNTLICSQITYTQYQINIQLKCLNLQSVLNQDAENIHMFKSSVINKRKSTYARNFNDNLDIQTISKTIFIQNQQEEINIIHQHINTCGNLLHVLVNEDQLLQISYQFTNQNINDSQYLNKQLNDTYQVRRIKQTLNSNQFIEKIAPNQYLLPKRIIQSQTGQKDEQLWVQHSGIKFINKYFLRRLLQQYNIQTNISNGQKSRFIKFNQSVDNNVLIILYETYFIVLQTPLLVHIQQVHDISMEDYEIESLIYNHRTLIIKNSESIYTAFNLNIPFDRNQLVVYPDRFCVQTMLFTIFQNLCNMQHQLSSFTEFFPIIDFVMNQYTPIHLIIIQNAFQATNVYSLQLIQEQFQLDTMLSSQMLLLIHKFIQSAVSEISINMRIDYNKLIKFKTFMNNYSENPLQSILLQEFNAQFMRQFKDKFSLKYFIKILQNYSINSDFNILNLNFEEHAIAAQQLLCYQNIMAQVQCNKTCVINIECMQLAALLFATAIDIGSAKRINISKVLIQKYQNLLKYLQFNQILSSQGMLQLPLMLMLIINPEIQFTQGITQYRPVKASDEEFIDKLFLTFSDVIKNNTSQMHQNGIIDFKTAKYQNKSMQNALGLLKNSSIDTEVGDFYVDNLISQLKYIKTAADKEQVFTQIIQRMFSNINVQQYLNGIEQFEKNQVLTQLGNNMPKIIQALSYALACGFNWCPLKSEKSLINLQSFCNFIMQSQYAKLFTPYGTAIQSLSDKNKFVQGIIGLVYNGDLQHSFKMIDFCNNLYDLDALQIGRRDPQSKHLIQLGALIRSQSEYLRQKGLIQQNINKSVINSKLAESKVLQNSNPIEQSQLNDDYRLKQQLVNDQLVGYSPLPYVNSKVGVLPNTNDINDSQAQNQQQTNNQDQSGIQHIDSQLLDDVCYYDPDKEISIVNVETTAQNANLYRQQQHEQIQQQLLQPGPQIPPAQSSLLSNSIGQSSKPVQIKRIRAQDILNNVQLPEKQTYNNNLPQNLPPQKQQIYQTQPQMHQQQQFQPIKPQITLVNNQNQPNNNVLRPNTIQLVQYNRTPGSEIHKHIAQPVAPRNQPQKWQQTQFLQQPGAYNRLQPNYANPIVQLSQPQRKVQMPAIDQTQFSIPKQNIPNYNQQFVPNPQQSYPMVQQPQANNIQKQPSQIAQPTFRPSQQQQYLPQQQPEQYVQPPQQVQQLPQHSTNHNPEPQSPSVPVISIQQAKPTYKVVRAGEKKPKFDYSQIQEAIGPMIDRNPRPVEENHPAGYKDIPNLPTQFQPPTQNPQLLSAIPGSVAQGLSAPQSGIAGYPAAPWAPGNISRPPAESRLTQPTIQQNNQLIPALPTEPNDSISSVKSQDANAKYPPYQSPQMQSYELPKPQPFPDVKIESSIIDLNVPERTKVPEVSYEPINLPRDALTDEIDQLMAKAKQAQQRAACFIDAQGRQPATLNQTQQLEDALMQHHRQMALDNGSMQSDSDVHGLTDALNLFK